MNNDFFKTVVVLIGIILISVLSYILIIKINSYLISKTLSECSKIATQTLTKNNGENKVSFPVESIYQKCIEKSGVN